MALPAFDVSLVAILLEDVLNFRREALVRVAVRIMIGGGGGMMWILESENMERWENERSDMMRGGKIL